MIINSGDLKTFNIVDILQVISMEEKNCIFAVESKDGIYGVYFNKGNPVYVRKVKRNFLLYIDLDFDTVLKRDKVEREHLFRNLATNLPLIFRLKEGRFSITSGFIKYPEDLPIYVETRKLIIHLSRNLTEEEVNRKITDMSMVYEKTPNINQDLVVQYMNEREKEIYYMIDGVKKVSDIVVKLHFDRMVRSERPLSLPEDEYESEQLYKETELEVKRSLYGFISAGIIRKKKPINNKQRNILNKIKIQKIQKLISSIPCT